MSMSTSSSAVSAPLVSTNQSTPQLGSYLENYLESVASLPMELRRNFTLMKELDTTATALLENVEINSKAYLSELKKSVREKREPPSDKLKTVRDDYQASLNFCDEKVALAVQSYELVDKHIRRLDGDLRKFEAELIAKSVKEEEKKKQNKKTKGITGNMPKAIGRKPVARSIVRPGPGSAPPPPNAQAYAAGAAAVPGVPGAPRAYPGAPPTFHSAPHISVAAMDMPIDPNEPTYCVCRRVSYGEMVECSNESCKIEWFHFECVGLAQAPKGKWYCMICRPPKNAVIVKKV
eukprot:TRINITY_DN88_c0_g3_i1.p1 TRINITY_DN88_c0_g3~~TRINITY_DN88_c0_g3_i1.p1  ORF type:complete len:292 (+),score=76.83 TRINITY_DN88_c0_g3_i1:152-1027(+)